MPAPDQHVLVIAPSSDERPLSKTQRAFNRYVERIRQLQQDLDNYRAWADLARQRVAQEVLPLEARITDLHADFVRLLDRQHGLNFFRAAEKKILAELIADQAFALIEGQGREELKPLFEKYSGDDFDKVNAEADAEIGETLKEVFTQLFGFEPADDVDVSSPEKLQAYLAQHRTEQREAAEERRARRTKTPRQEAAESRRQGEEKKLSTAVRKIYLDLVKAFHPDREPDETERARKTEIMQRVTQAYEANSLFDLLKLQLDYNRIDRDHLDALADAQLNAYNKLLKGQVAELEGEWQELLRSFGPMAELIGPPAEMELRIKQEVKRRKKSLKDLSAQLLRLEDPAELREYLKAWKKAQRQRARIAEFF